MNIKKYTEKDRYGNMFSYEFDVPSMQEIPNPEIFKPKGTDTVPAMLTPGENVVNAEASRLPGVQPMLDKLNDAGRAIQKKQGGPIPSYNSEGAQIDYYGNNYNQSTVNSEISTLKGMGLSDAQIIQALMNNLNMSQGEAQAALMPAYKADGGVIVDDAMLDAIKQVESGGDPNALSGVGAGGQYQIMPKTAQQPGYGTTPISLEDRFDPEKSRAFAKQYLQGIIKQHPEFTKDQVLTAYHSGAGNVLKNNIGPVGQAYAGKVNAEIGDVPVQTAMYDGNELSYPNAQNYGNRTNEEIPNPQKDGVGYGGLDKNIYSHFGPSGISPDSLSVESIVDEDPSGGELTADMEAKKIAAQKVTDQLNDEEDIDQTVMNNEEVTQWIKDNPEKNIVEKFIDKGKKVGGPILDKSMEYFKDAFSSMFNGEELARMAIIYAGSRAMGYNHGGSLNYSMKNYIKRVDANAEAAKKFALTEKARDDFEMDSLKEYARTGDIDVLIPKAKTLTVKAPAGSVYARGFGQLPTFTMSDGTTKVFHRGQYKSPNHPDLRGRVEKMDSQVHGDVAVSKRFADNANSQIKVANDEYGLKQVGGDKPSDNTVKINANDLGQQANAFYRNVLRRNAISVNDAPAYEAAINRGIAKYLDAKVQAKINKSEAPVTLRSYLNAEVFVPLTGIDQGMVKNTTEKNLESIQDMVTNNIPYAKDDPRFQTQLEKEFGYREIAFKWMVRNDKVAYGNLLKDVEARLDDKGKGWDAFSYWVSKTSEKEIEDILVKAGYGK